MTPGSAQVPVLQLNIGVGLPALGFGVFQTPPEQTVFGFDLTADQLVAIDALDTDVRGGPERSRSPARHSDARSLRPEA